MPAHTIAALTLRASAKAPSTEISTPFEARTGPPSRENRRQAYSGFPAARFASRRGSIADVKAIIENRGTRRNPITRVASGPVFGMVTGLGIGCLCHTLL